MALRAAEGGALIDVDEMRRRGQQRHGRRGSVFSVRLTDDQRARLEEKRQAGGGPRALGPLLVWAALREPGITSSIASPVLPRREPPGTTASSAVLPELVALGSTAAGALGSTAPRPEGSTPPAVGTTATAAKLILDLCAGSGSWSAPYEAAGYRVLRVTLPEHDVRTFIPPAEPVWGIVAAPPCEQFSLARNGHPTLPRDFVRGMECVNACLRIIQQCAPRWWALENPQGLLSEWLGTATDWFEPCDFGDPWTKRTQLWGSFTLPTRGPFVEPIGGGPLCAICDPDRRRSTWCSNAAHRAITAPGFARAFCEANP